MACLTSSGSAAGHSAGHVFHTSNKTEMQALEAGRTFMMMIAKTKGMSPGMSQAQKTFTSCRHRAGHQQLMRNSCNPTNTLLRQ